MVGKHSKRHRAERQHRAKPNWRLHTVILLGVGLGISVIALAAQQLTQPPSKSPSTSQTQQTRASQIKKTSQSSSKQTTASNSKSSSQKSKTKDSSKTSASRAKKQEKKATKEKAATGTWLRQEATVKVPILTYQAVHDIAPEEQHNAHLIVSPATFESHIKALSEAGYYFLTPEEAYRVFTKNELPAKKVIWITFDGGHRDVYDQALPILKKYQAKATVNVVINPILTNLPQSLTLEQISEMKQHGIAVQSQGLSNANLAISYPEAQANELAVSKSWLDEELSQETLVFTYPSGQYSPDTVNFATQNYKLALTQNQGLAQADNGLLTLNRLSVLPTTTAEELLASLR